MSRYNICKETLITNIEYAKQKNINIIICLFDDTIRFYSNIKISDESIKIINDTFKKSYKLNDNLSYDEMIYSINNSHPEGGTDFLVPFEFLSCIKEINTSSEIFFLSDGCNNQPLTDINMMFLESFKKRVTTLGIGSKTNFDSITLSKLSKTNDTIEGINSDIIQQELLAQMADMTIVDTMDIWKDIEITLMCNVNNLKVGSMMQASVITEEEYKSTNFIQNTDNSNLVLSIGNNNEIMISKMNVKDQQADLKTELLIFIVDQSGSMDTMADNNIFMSPLSINVKRKCSIESACTEQLEENIEPIILEYVKYTMKLPNMKSYQRVLFSVINDEFKGQISWKDSKNNIQTMNLHNLSKYVKINDVNIEKAIDVACNIGHYINIASISNKSDNIGYFRKIYQISKTNKKFLNDILEKKLVKDFSLIEILFYNNKQGIKLFNSTMNQSEQNMHHLLEATSAGGGYKMLSAAATMSIAVDRTPSSQGGGNAEENYNIRSRYRSNRNDMSMCTICFDEIREYIFSCGHCYACKSCAETLLHSDPKNKCSYCKNDVTYIRKIMMTEDQKNKEHYYKCISEDCYNIASIVTKCEPINTDDSGYHLTHCEKCHINVKREVKKIRKTQMCFCGKEIVNVVDKIYFN